MRILRKLCMCLWKLGLVFVILKCEGAMNRTCCGSTKWNVSSYVHAVGLHLEALEKQEISRICVLSKPAILQVHSQKHMYYKCIAPGRILGAEETALVFRVGPSPTNAHVAFWLNSLPSPKSNYVGKWKHSDDCCVNWTISTVSWSSKSSLRSSSFSCQ